MKFLGAVLLVVACHVTQSDDSCYKNTLTLCDSVPNYPLASIRSALLSAGFAVKPTSGGIWRGSDFDPGIPACSSKHYRVNPQEGVTADKGTKVLIVNVPQLFEQAIDTEVCTKVNGSCDSIARYIGNQYTPNCQQQFINVTMKTFENNNLTQRLIKVPTACTCFITSNYI